MRCRHFTLRPGYIVYGYGRVFRVWVIPYTAASLKSETLQKTTWCWVLVPYSGPNDALKLKGPESGLM